MLLPVDENAEVVDKSKKIERPGGLKNVGHRPRSSIIQLPGKQNRAKGMSTYIHSALCYFQK